MELRSSKKSVAPSVSTFFTIVLFAAVLFFRAFGLLFLLSSNAMSPMRLSLVMIKFTVGRYELAGVLVTSRTVSRVIIFSLSDSEMKCLAVQGVHMVVGRMTPPGVHCVTLSSPCQVHIHLLDQVVALGLDFVISCSSWVYQTALCFVDHVGFLVH